MMIPLHAISEVASLFFSSLLPRKRLFEGGVLFFLTMLPFAAQAQIENPPKAPLISSATNGFTHGNRVSQWFDLTPALQRHGQTPRAAEDCAMMYNPILRRVILFGGKDNNDVNLNEIWSLDLATEAWEQLHAKNEGPPASEDHTVIYDPLGHRMIVYGGENGFTTNATWSFDFKTQSWRNMTAPNAPAREDHSAIYDARGKRMVIFGGRDNDGQNDYINIHEVWALDLNPQSPRFEKWQPLKLEADDKPPQGRSDHAVVYDSLKNRMVIFAGWDKDKKEFLKDTWAFYFEDSTGSAVHWRQIKTKYSHPPERRHAAGVYDPARNCFIIFGGFGDEGYLNDVWALDLTTDIWVNLTPGPQPRLDHQAVYDRASGRLLLYGGDARLHAKFHDVWELQIDPATSLEALEHAATTKVKKAKNKKD